MSASRHLILLTTIIIYQILVGCAFHMNRIVSRSSNVVGDHRLGRRGNMNTTTMVNLFWSKGDDKPKDESSKSSQSTKQTSKMGTTATTMENFKQSQELGKKTSSLIQELSSIQVEGVAAKGKIKVILDGQQQPVGVEIDEDYFKQGGVDDFSETLLVAMQDAHKKSLDIMQEKMQGLYGSLGLPPSR